ncbi:MAG: helix-turn-helix transcriptional regulator [Clostridia bacterium]|nr:helix-turn-helix transcriptional regulator [Clostridia bacterium]
MNSYQRLRDLREDADKSQEEIAKIIGTSQSYYAQYENGKRAIPLVRMIALARYYNVSLDYLTGLIDTPRKLR